MTTVISMRVDCRGMIEPMAVLALRRAIDALPVGHVLELISSDPAAPMEFPAWCRCTGHEIVEMYTRDDQFCFYIRKTC
jgi:tRNA 2-thiouridine synthesizing protein A